MADTLETLLNHRDLLAEALGKLLQVYGVTRPHAALTGPELIMAAEEAIRHPVESIRDISEDELTMAMCAIRYTIGRQSYIVSDGVAWARKYGTASSRVREVIIRDLEEASDRVNKGFAGALGGDLDEAAWREVLVELKALPREPVMGKL